MAVRYFDGSIGEGIAVSGGAIGALCNGAYSVVVIAKTVVPNGGNENRAFLGIQVAATDLLGSLCTYNSSNPGGLRVFTDTEESQDSGMDLDDSWQILGYSKASGTTAVRFHRKELGAGSWTHRPGAGSIANDASSVTRVEFGRFMGGAFSSSLDGHLAVAALFPAELSDAAFESIQTTPATATLVSLGAVGLWELNQESTATSVVDRTGGGADQTAITGTTAVTGDDPPGWTFLPPPITFLHTAANANFAATVGVSLADDVPVGSLIVVHTTGLGGTDVVVTDAWGVEYTLIGSPQVISTGIDQVAWAITTRPLYAGERLHSEWDGGGSDTSIRYCAYSGCDGTLLDTAHGVDNTFPQSQIADSGPVTIPATETLLVTSVTHVGGSNFSTPTSGFTIRGDGLSYTSSWRFYMEDRIVTGGAGDYSSGPTSGEDKYWSATLLAFSAGTPPDTGETILTVPIAVAGDDGSGYIGGSGAEWPPTASFNADDGTVAYAAKGRGATDTYSNTALFRFDTSSLPDAAEIIAARLGIYVISHDEPAHANLLEGDYYDFGGEPTVVGDWVFTIASSIFPSLDRQLLTNGENNWIILTDLTGINPSGYTGIRLALSDIGMPGAGSNRAVEIATHENANPEAVLEIAYTEAEEGSPVMWLGTN